MLKTLGVHFIRHPCLTRTVRVRTPITKNNTPLLSWRKCSGVVESCLLCWFRIVRNFGQALSRILAFAVVWVGASLRRLCATAIVHPCTTRTVRVRTPQHQKKQGYACLGITLLFWCRWRGSNPHGIATNGF